MRVNGELKIRNKTALHPIGRRAVLFGYELWRHVRSAMLA